jgi:tRNA-splicing ligase RtcB (3'-phosphate/5'-hydroxy nucleic acid ligase)
MSEIREENISYRIWGKEQIEPGAIDQMNNAMRLPISLAGALMPDAHIGYGLPIGGVLATEGAVIPYAVGVDIACRMRMSIFDTSPHVLGQQTGKFKNALLENTNFGAGGSYRGHDRAEHAVLDDPAWTETGFLATLKDKAYEQLGTSGGGNHFVEWGALNLLEDDETLGLKQGQYLALLSHSGSRGVGYKIADRFSRLAREQHPTLDQSVQHLAWLPLESSLGYEYWLSMTLAGRFAAANHEIIHHKVTKAANLKPAAVVENHHNYAWKQRIETQDGEREVIVHRKGSTPAGEGEYGVIPGTMGDAGYVVRGTGNVESLASAAHGAGRQMSRTQAKKTITKSERDRYLKDRNIMLLGGDLDEAPQAYKSIDMVMAAQRDLVDVVAKFEPRIVRMDGSTKKRKKRRR